MRSSGINTRMKITKCSNLFFIAFLFFSHISLSEECTSVKDKILSQADFSQANLASLKIGVDSDNQCFKNLMGIMLYNGLYFDKDEDRAEKIFYDLSNKDYPEAQFNFGLALTKKHDQDPENVIVLLLGIYKKYGGSDKAESHLASKARNLARFYVDNLNSLVADCKNKTAKCSKDFSAINDNTIQNISNKLEVSLSNSQFEIATDAVNKSKAFFQKYDDVMTIVAIGTLVYGVTAASSYSGGGGAGAPSTPSGSNPWFNYGQGFGNPLNLYQFGL
jgi:hypothetical protein